MHFGLNLGVNVKAIGMACCGKPPDSLNLRSTRHVNSNNSTEKRENRNDDSG